MAAGLVGYVLICSLQLLLMTRNTGFSVMAIVIKFIIERPLVGQRSFLTVFMVRIISIILLQMTFITPDNPIDLNPADLILCIGQSFHNQNTFSVSDFTDSPGEVKDEYEPRIISKTTKNPKQFTLFGLSVDEIHIGLDSSDKILAIYVRLENQDLVKKMEKAIGDEYVAVGVTPEGLEAPPSTYWWDYKGQCVSLKLYANQRMFIREIPAYDGLVTFFNCDPRSYMDLLDLTAEADKPGFNDPEILQQKNDFLQLAYSFYPKGMSDQGELYGMTPQFRKLYQTLQKNDYMDQKWQQLLDILQQRFKCRDIGIADPIKRDYRIAIVLETPRPHNIVVNISKLIPYYCLYTELAPGSKSGGRLSGYIFKNFISSDQEIIDWISEQIHLYFDGYTQFPPELPLVKFKDVVFEDRGVLAILDDEFPGQFESMTLFNAFFSSDMFYW